MSSGTAGVEGAVFEPPFPIPESWVWTKLGEIGDTNIGLTYHPQDISDNGIPVLRSNNIQNGNLVLSSLVRVACHILPSQFIKNGDVLICARNGSKALVGKSVLVDSLVEPTSFGAFMAVFRSQFNPFIQLFLQSDEFKQYLNKSNSTTIHQLTQSMLKDAWMPFPSFPEQQRIVKRFEALSALCDAIDIQSVSLSVLAEQAKQKVLDLAIRGLLVSQNPTDEPASTLLDRIRSTADKPPCPNRMSESFESPFPIPDTWEWTTIREINEYERKTLQPDPGSEEVFELYSVPVFESGLPEFVKGTEISSPKQVVRKGDVLVCKINPRINRVWNVAGHTDSRLLASSEWIVVRAKDIVSGYLKIVFQSPYFRAKLLTNVSGVGGSLMRAQAGFVMDYPFPIPPLAEQRRIVAKVEELFSAIDAMATK